MQQHPTSSSEVLLTDIFTLICEHIVDVRTLGRICTTNKQIANYLLSAAGDKHWVKAGKLICGEEYWSDKAFDESQYVIYSDPIISKTHEIDGRYQAKIHICPWLSDKKIFPLHGMRAFDSLNTRYRVCGALRLFQSKDLDKQALKDKLCLDLEVNDSQYVRGGIRSITFNARYEDIACGCVNMPTTVVAERKMTTDESILLADLEADKSNFEKYGNPVAVRIIHRSMFAAFFEESCGAMGMRFLSLNSHKNELWYFQKCWFNPNMFENSPGEMWSMNHISPGEFSNIFGLNQHF